MAEWFYNVGDERIGPVSGSALKQLVQAGTVTPESLVWTQGAADWVPARRVKGLFPTPAAPAPVPVAVAVPEAMPTPQVAMAEVPLPLAAPGLTGTLQYASAGLIDGSVEPAPFAPPPPDSGPFHLLGKSFTVGKQQWVGKAIVSPQAIYLWKVSRPNHAAYGVGGLVGVAIRAATAKADDLSRSCDITELPDAVRRFFDPKLKKFKGDIVILNRDALTLVKTTGWNNTITPFVALEKFPIVCGMFGRGKARAFMRDQGWTLDLTVQATAAPTHGRGYGLDEETVRQRTHKSLWVRIGSGALGLGIAALYIWFRIWAATHR